jgi:calcineurin-like phosphoesterase family protein
MDVGVDTNNYFPYSEECIKERMAKKEASDPETKEQL